MLQEAIELQHNAVTQLLQMISQKDEITFRAPTGSGKTRMMCDFMNRVLSTNSNIVFLVSTLSKGGLAEQNYQVFRKCADSGLYSALNPCLIDSETSGEEQLFIPTDYNVYVLPRDLYKDKSKLKDQGVLLNFLQEITANLFGSGKNKQIYLIKDECHQATNNLDELKRKCYFQKIINFSATPNLKRGQTLDVEITDAEAEQVKLIKHVELDDNFYTDTEQLVEKAICEFEPIKQQYINLLGVNPCLIIQISNKEKADVEWKKIKTVLNKNKHQSLKWMSIMDKKDKCETNDQVGKLSVDRWKDYAKSNASTIDVIIFKMVISEGWDIPRACMLCQVRNTQSEQLDEQVVGRVRRNPRLVDFERLPLNAQKLAMTAWVWGVLPENKHKTYQVQLFGDENNIPQLVKIKTTRLKPLTQRKGFNISTFIAQESQNSVTSESIFKLYAKFQNSENTLRELGYDYAQNSAQKWFLYCLHLDAVKKEYDNFVCDYSQSMEITKDCNGNDKEVSFPLTSSYADNANYENIGNWVWKRKDGADKFSFDSEAEREWAAKLKDLSQNDFGVTTVGEPNPLYGQDRNDGSLEPKLLNEESKMLWGKNFLQNSEIYFEYYLHGVHASYPDFVMKDKKGRIHLFEIKSVNVSNSVQMDSEEYKAKINALKECYKQCSKLTDYFYYLPILKNDSWQITRYYQGIENVITLQQFEQSL